MLALATSSLAALGCGVPCAEDPIGGGFVDIKIYLPPLFAMTEIEMVAISSPIQASGTVPFYDGSFNLTSQSPPHPRGALTTEGNGDRFLDIIWQYMDTDARSPPTSDQFDVTVTDNSGTVIASLAQTVPYTWNPPIECAPLGYWSGPTLSDDGGTVDGATD